MSMENTEHCTHWGPLKCYFKALSPLKRQARFFEYRKKKVLGFCSFRFKFMHGYRPTGDIRQNGCCRWSLRPACGLLTRRLLLVCLIHGSGRALPLCWGGIGDQDGNRSPSLLLSWYKQVWPNAPGQGGRRMLCLQDSGCL